MWIKRRKPRLIVRAARNEVLTRAIIPRPLQRNNDKLRRVSWEFWRGSGFYGLSIILQEDISLEMYFATGIQSFLVRFYKNTTENNMFHIIYIVLRSKLFR